MATKLITVRQLRVGDVLVTAYDTQPRTVTKLEPVTTTAAGGERTRPPTQLLVSSRDEQHALYSDCQYLGSLVRVRE